MLEVMMKYLKMTTIKMEKPEMNKELEKFLFTVQSGEGDFLDIAAQNNLSVFATHVGYISGLASNGKLSTEEAYSQVKKLHKALKQSYRTLKGSWFG